jgi:hypothetical protein
MDKLIITSATASDTPSSPAPPEVTATDARIHLQVGERRFTTTRATLTEESDFFAALLSGRWDNTLPDGSYFIDADPTLFEHILAYLRRGVFPLFFDAAKGGHDHHRYLSLLKEAQYFQIPRLEAWLKDKRYLAAVKVVSTAQEYNEDQSGWQGITASAGTTLEYHPRWTIRKTYLCPRGIAPHRGNPGGCGRQCAAARASDGDKFDEELSAHMLVITRTVMFDPEVCLAREED